MEIANEGCNANDEESGESGDKEQISPQISKYSLEQSPVRLSPPSPVHSPELTAKAEGSDILDCLTCTICSSRTFSTRQELLHHLSLTHFNRLLLQQFPLKVKIYNIATKYILNPCYQDGDMCPIEDCTVQLSNKVVHLLHVGKLHEKVLTFLETPASSPSKEDNKQQEETGSEPSIHQAMDKPRSDYVLDSVTPHMDEAQAVTEGTSVEEDKQKDIQEEDKDGTEESEVSPGLQNHVTENAMTPAKPQDPIVEDVIEDDFKPVVKLEASTIQCTLCEKNNKVRTFGKKSEFLKHLSLIHYGKQILTLFPWSLGDMCRFCLESASRKEYRANKKELHVCHVAIMHQKLFELLPPEVSQLISAIPATRGRAQGGQSSLQCKYCDQRVARGDMRQHLISHKTLISQRANQEFKFSP